VPIDKYFKGEGDKVMSSMKQQYGEKAAERVFYATANKKGMKPKTIKRSPRKKV
jgi:hypothetical protein